MSMLDEHETLAVIVVNRTPYPGFAGIPNPLFAADNTLLFFADGKKAILDIIAAYRAT